MKNDRKPLAVRILVTALTPAALMAAVFLIFGEIDGDAALCRMVGWGFAQLLCLAGGIALAAGAYTLWKWGLGPTSGKGRNGEDCL